MRQTNKASSPPSNFKKVGHVYLHPEDDTAFYSPVTFRNDPKKFRPLPREDPRFKEMRVYKWGFYELEDIMRDPDSDGETCYSDDKDYAEACSRMQMFRTMYGNKKIFWYHSFPNPEEQFINILIDRKLRYIKNHQAIQNACQHCSLTIKVSLHMNEEDVWRIIRVPASTSLAEMHDQVLVPAMGWSRCYHAYVFEDKQDGAAIGPQMNSGFVDMMWVKDNYKAFMDSRKVPLAALMRSVGDECLYLYDLGDAWRHRLKVISVTDIEGEESVEILDGRGACPPEDSVGLEGQGVESYHNFLQSYKSNANSLAVKEKLQKMSLAMNYTSHWLTGQAIPFKPLDYNLEFHRYILRQMVEGPRMEKPPKYWDFSPDFNECAACKDRLKPLMACSQCKKVKYCSKECQRSDWKMHKPLCKLLAHSNK